METAHQGATDARLHGVAGIIVGILFLVLASLVVIIDLPVPGGNVYGSEGQSVVLLAFVGIAGFLIGALELQKDG